MKSCRRFMAIIFFSAASGHGSIYTVTHTRDDGSKGSLRWAMQQTESNPGWDLIDFHIRESDAGFNGQYWTITPKSALPEIYGPVTINGGTQTDNVRNSNLSGPEILIDGGGAGPSTAGIMITGSQNAISGLCIGAFSHSGIFLFGSEAHDNTIISCIIGLAPDGLTPLPNHIGMVLSLGADRNMIGGVFNGNCISGNESDGIQFFQAHDNTCIGNRIGTDASGFNAAGNGRDWVRLESASTGNYIGDWIEGMGNLISGNGSAGIRIADAETRGNFVRQNRIGTNVNGLLRVPNGNEGILITGGARANIVDERNLVSGNLFGVIIADAGTDSNRVSGNWIGLDATGTDTIPNLLHGLRIENGARYNVIGGDGPGFRNVISGNGWSAMGTLGDSTAYNLFAYNWCGLDTSGTKALGNGFYGIHFGALANRASNNNLSGNRCGVVVGGYSEKCVIEYNAVGIAGDGEEQVPNHDAGIRVLDNASHDTLRANRVTGNEGWGVELKGSGVRGVTLTMNGISMNADGGILLSDGANGGTEPPTVEHADAGMGQVRGVSAPRYRVEVFQDEGAQGSRFLGASVADDQGAWAVDVLCDGPNVTATATDGQGNTSVFSAQFPLSSGVGDPAEGLPHNHELFQNYPIPFNPSTTIRFSVADPCRARLKVYDIRGKEVAVVADDLYTAGSHAVRYDASGLASGIYIYKIQMGSYTASRKMAVLE
jgi:hypothetical protein